MIQPVPWACALGVLLATAPTFGQVFKCTGADGKVEYSNVACAAGAKLTTPDLRANTLDTSGMRRENQQELQRNRAEQRSATAVMNAGAVPSARYCPSDLEIRNMETSASSSSKGPKEQEFLQDEVRRARQCQAGQGNYTRQDWEISRQARDDQSSATNQARGRARAEAMHSAADPVEGQRIHERRLAEEAARSQREAIARAAVAAPPLVLVTRCDNKACMGNDGIRYNRVGTGFAGPKGQCRQVGQHLKC